MRPITSCAGPFTADNHGIMFRKTIAFGAAALAASAMITLSGAEASLAKAAGFENQPAAAPVEEQAEPRFVTGEVVQPLPEQDDANGPDSYAQASNLRQLVTLVSKNPETLSKNLRCLATAVYFEARGEPLAGQLAVAEVIVNRAASGAFPSSYCGVVYQRAQFSFVRHGRAPSVRRNTAAWRRAKAIARIAHEDLWNSRAGDSLYFHAKSVRPRWSSQKVELAIISSHVFYK